MIGAWFDSVPFYPGWHPKKHIENYRDNFKKVIQNIKNRMYVDDLISGENIV